MMAHKKITLWRSADSLAQNVKLEENNQTKNIWGNLYSESLLETSFPFFLYLLTALLAERWRSLVTSLSLLTRSSSPESLSCCWNNQKSRLIVVNVSQPGPSPAGRSPQAPRCHHPWSCPPSPRPSRSPPPECCQSTNP